MSKVFGIHLHGKTVQVEEQGFTVLQAYLDDARRQLAGNPDAAQIILGLEQAIAEKSRRFMRPRKDVLLNGEVETIIEEIGRPFEPDRTTAKTRAESESTSRLREPRKLYRLRNDGMVEGACAGIAAYFDVDPTIVRLIAVILLILSSGAAVVIYLVLVLVVPEGKAGDEHAAARRTPFDSGEAVEGRPRESSEQERRGSRGYAYWRRRLQWNKGGLDVLLAVVAFIAGIRWLVHVLRWPFRSPVLQDALITPYDPWGGLLILVALTAVLTAAARTLASSDLGIGRVMFAIVNVSLAILAVMLVVYLSPLALAGILRLWSWMIGAF